MTLYQFNLLDKMEQAEVLWDKAVMVSDRSDETYKYVLYQLDNFYVEVKYHIEYNVIHGLRSFSSTGEPLSPYLNKINISELG